MNEEEKDNEMRSHVKEEIVDNVEMMQEEKEELE